MPRGSYNCDKCPSVFSNYTTLIRHQESHALSESVASQGNETEGLKLSAHRDGAIMRCTTCDLAFTTVGVYQMHMKKYHDKALECEDCGMRFTLPNGLKRHRLTNHTQFPRRCDDCGHLCTSKEEFIKHMEEVHDSGLDVEMVPCEQCGSLFRGHLSLKIHMKNQHEEDKQTYPCDLCGKVLKNKYNLEYHMKSHTGEYKFRCDECGRGYMTRKKMLRCKNNHAGIFMYKCTMCDFKTNCDKSYKRHQGSHSTEKPFICPVCINHTCSHVGALSSHIRKSHKMTLLQAEMISRRTRLGVPMTDADIEVAKQKAEVAEKSLETFRNREMAPGYIHPNHSRPNTGDKKSGVKSQPPGDDESNDGPPTLYPPPSRLLYPYF